MKHRRASGKPGRTPNRKVNTITHFLLLNSTTLHLERRFLCTQLHGKQYIHSLLQLRVKSFLVVVYNFETCNEFLYVNRTKLVQKSIEIVWFRRFFLNSSSRKFQTTFKLRIENKIRIELTWVVVITVAVVFFCIQLISNHQWASKHRCECVECIAYHRVRYRYVWIDCV